MKHYIFRDNADGRRIALACDADAAERFGYYFGRFHQHRLKLAGYHR